MAVTIRMFIVIGKGTLAPWSPMKEPVTSSVYAYLINPMISSVLVVQPGEVLALGL